MQILDEPELWIDSGPDVPILFVSGPSSVGGGTMSEVDTPTLSQPVDAERDYVQGPADAPVTLVQYGDFECPGCGDMYPVIKRIQERLGHRLRFVFRHFPLSKIHSRAKHAAEAAETAGAQSDELFWRMHDTLYENQDALSDADLKEYAAQLNLDTERFEREFDNHDHEESVREDLSSGARSGVNGTPTFFINGERYDGPRDFDSLLRALAEAGGLTDVRRSVQAENAELRETIDRSRRGAPAAGEAVRDLFSADEIFQRIIATADEEFSRSNRLLFMSGIVAGLCITLSFLARAALLGSLPAEWGGLVANLFYPIGFLFIVLGRYQLFTENTLTPVTLVLTRIASLPSLLRVWVVVIVANVLGAAMGAFVLARTGVFSPEAAEVAYGLGEHALSVGWWDLFFKGVFAGNLVAGMVWLVHAARDTTTRFFIVVFLMFLIPAADLYHCIIGAAEVLYVSFQGGATIAGAMTTFFIPVVLGNTVGGVLLVGILNYSHTRERRFTDRDCRLLELSWSEWLFGQHRGDPATPTFFEEEHSEAD